jgi:hypothetical protein
MLGRQEDITMISSAFESRLVQLREQIAERARAEATQKKSRDEQDRAVAREKAARLDEIERQTREIFEAARRVFAGEAKLDAPRKTGKRTRMALRRRGRTLVVQIDHDELTVEIRTQESTKKAGPSAPPYIGRDIDPRVISDAVIQDVVLAFLRGEQAPIRINWP